MRKESGLHIFYVPDFCCHCCHFCTGATLQICFHDKSSMMELPWLLSKQDLSSWRNNKQWLVLVTRAKSLTPEFFWLLLNRLNLLLIICFYVFLGWCACVCVCFLYRERERTHTHTLHLWIKPCNKFLKLSSILQHIKICPHLFTV